MSKRRTGQILAQLKQLADEAKENLYTRIGLAIEVLQDLDWIALVHEGSIDVARQALEDEYFRDLGGYVTLGKLMQMYQTIPREEWDACRHNIAAIEVIFDGKETKPEPLNRQNWKKAYDDLLEAYEELQQELANWKQVAEERGVKIQELQEQITNLQTSSARLEGRVEELSKRFVEAGV